MATVSVCPDLSLASDLEISVKIPSKPNFSKDTTMKEHILDIVNDSLSNVTEAEAALGSPKPRFVGGGELTLAEMVCALKNIGFDLTCGQCASIFYTGSGTYQHDATCQTKQ